MKPFFFTLLAMLALISACRGSETATTSRTASRLINDSVQNSAGDFVGTVNDIVIDDETGAIQYIVLLVPKEAFPYGKAAMVTSSRELLPVPWDLFTVKASEQALILNVDDSELESAPRFDELPELESDWDRDIRQHWQMEKR